MKKPGTLLLAALLALPSIGCVVHGSARVRPVAVVEVHEPPPPPPPRARVVVTTRPGFVWIEGRHVYRNGRYVWVDGRYERERSGHYWVQGRWERRGNRHVWVDGRWQRGRGPAVRDNRDRRDRRDRPVTRDHRR
jgi:hypothetical protein